MPSPVGSGGPWGFTNIATGSVMTSGSFGMRPPEFASVLMPPLPACRECGAEEDLDPASRVAVVAERMAAVSGVVLFKPEQRNGTDACVQVSELCANQLVLVHTARSNGGFVSLFAVAKNPCPHPRASRVCIGVAPPNAEVLGAHGPVCVYRTSHTLRGLAGWFAEQGDSLRCLVWLERAILLRARNEEVTSANDAQWERYQKLKALALQPGTAAEGQAALRAALGLAWQLAGSEE